METKRFAAGPKLGLASKPNTQHSRSPIRYRFLNASDYSALTRSPTIYRNRIRPFRQPAPTKTCSAEYSETTTTSSACGATTVFIPSIPSTTSRVVLHPELPTLRPNQPRMYRLLSRYCRASPHLVRVTGVSWPTRSLKNLNDPSTWRKRVSAERIIWIRRGTRRGRVPVMRVGRSRA